jgi:putative nucleotidyltransferase with HDIG domain
MNIKLLPRELVVGMTVIEPIITPTGQVLATKGTPLTRQIINKTKLYNVENVVIDSNDPILIQLQLAAASTAEEPELEPVMVQQPIMMQQPVMMQPIIPPTPVVAEPIEPQRVITYKEETQSNSRRMMASNDFKDFQVDYLLFIEHVKDVFKNVSQTPGYTIDITDLIERMGKLYASRNTIVELFDMINQMRTLSDTVYGHCVNVALISRMIGRWLHLERNDLDVLTCCGLFHDVGKTSIPEEVLNKPDKLTDQEFALIKSHPKLGYEILRTQDIDTRIKQSALMHHERYDGSGYPSNLSSELLADFAMIVAIADVYDAMTTARSYREPLCAFEVIEKFEIEGFQKYHTKYIYVFLQNIARTYQSNRVMLNDGRGCKIVMLNQNALSKPIVQFDDGSCLDLSSQRELRITKVM